MKNKQGYTLIIGSNTEGQASLLMKPIRKLEMDTHGAGTYKYYSRLKNIILVLCAGLIIMAPAACSMGKPEPPPEPNSLTEEEENEGWELVFNGETLHGWRGLNRDFIHQGHWIIEDGSLKKVARDSISVNDSGESPPGGDLVLDSPVNNFEFAFEWKISPGGNSGIKYNVSEELTAAQGNPYAALGLEYQVLDDPEYSGVQENPNMGTSGLYDLVDPTTETNLNPPGEWNTGRIVFNGNYGEHWLNGERILTFEMNTPEMDSAFQESKWSDIDGFRNRHQDSYITIQDHGDAVWYRNLKLRELQ